MAKKEIWIDDEQMPHSVVSSVIARMMDGKALKAFWEDYKNNRMVGRGTMKPSDVQFETAKKARKSGPGSFKKVAKEMKLTIPQVRYAVHRVAIWEYLQG